MATTSKSDPKKSPAKKPAAKKSTPRPPSTGAKKKKKGNSRSLALLLVIAIIVGGAYIGYKLGLVKAETVSGLLEDFNVDEIAAEWPVLDEGQVSFATVTPTVPAALGSEWSQLYFTTPRLPDEPQPETAPIMQGLIEVINSARTSLDIAIYELDLEPVAKAILAARDRGVAVRLVTDSDELEILEPLIRLQKAKVPIVGDERGPLMHNKFAVIDGQAVWTGSWNFTPNDTFRNNNNALYLRSPQLAQNFQVEFEEMFSAAAFGPTSPINTPNPRIIIDTSLIETCFAPEEKCADQLVSLLRQAQSSIRFLAFSFTNDDIGKIVIDRAKAGVIVQGVFETRGADTDASEYGRMRRQKMDVHLDGNPYTMHHKVFIIDNKTVVMGSFNFSDNADASNDENMLMIHDAGLAQQFQAEFERVYDQAVQAE